MAAFRRVAVLLPAVVGIGLAACSKTVPIGAIISETGAAASYGGKVRKGLDLALEEINAVGGFQGKTLELIYRDDATNPEVGRQVARSLVEEQGVGLIIGAVSSTVTLAISPICEEHKVVLLSPTASAPQITTAGDYIFRNYPSDILEGTAMANFARDLGLERVAVFAVANEYGAGLVDVFTGEFESRFRQIVRRVDFPEGRPESVASEVEALRSQPPDGIYIAAYVRDVAELIKRIRKAGLPSIILTSSSVTDAELVQLAGMAAEDLVFPRSSTFDPDSDSPTVRSFIEAYRERYGDERPDSFAAHGYDALKLLLLGMQKVGSTYPRDVARGLGAINDYEGPTGRLAFEEHGDVIQYPRLYVIRHGRAVPYDRFRNEGGSLQVPGRS
jgi:branched-chain amino acid transport system substrate-binding protein